MAFLNFGRKKQGNIAQNNIDQNTMIQNGTGQLAAGQQGMAADAVHIFAKKIGSEEVRKASEILVKYKSGKESTDKRIIDNEQWWKMEQWRMDANKDDQHSASGWTFNTVISKHADAIEAYPTFNCLPREEGDKREAQMLSSILPVVLEQNKFADTYNDCAWQKLKFGTAVYGIFWDKDKYNGLGDISIEKINILSLFTEPGIEDIQKSRNVFRTQLVDNEIIEELFPEVKGHLGNRYFENKFLYDDYIDVSDKSLVVDWYYKKNINGRKVLHYVRYVNDCVLFATENNPEMAEKGLYDHGEYPFVTDALFPVEGSLWAYSYIDICKKTQKDIDELGDSIVTNAKWTSRPRYFERENSGINEEEFADVHKMLVTTGSNLGDDTLKKIDTQPIDSINVTIRNNLIEELKEISGNRDVNNGGAASGVTAASAIAAMQEQSGKTSRDSSQNSYRSYEKIITMCIELVRQFYDIPRQFRITGANGNDNFVSYSNAGIKPQYQGEAFGIDLGYRVPSFDLKVTAEKANAYTKMSQNELALQFFNLGFFNPQMADQALMTLDMMDFDNREMLMNKLSQQQTMYNKLVQTQQVCLELCKRLDASQGSNLAEQYANAIMQETGQQLPAGDTNVDLPETDSLGNLQEENAIVSNARDKAQAATQPT